VEQIEPEIVASHVGSTPNRVVRSFAVLLCGFAGVVLGLVILTALARPAGAAPLALGSSPVSVPASVSVPGTGIQRVPPIAFVTQAATTKVADVSNSAPHASPGVPAVAPNTDGSLATPVLAAGNAAASPISIELGGPVSLLVDGFTIGVSNGPGITPMVAFGTVQSVGTRTVATANTPDNGLLAAPRQGSGNPSPSPAPPAPNRAPANPYPSPNSLLTANDVSDSLSGQGGSPFGSLPPSSLLLSVLALGGVLFARGTRPQLLLDSRCSPPG
jgi:hypothetical protein